MTTQEGFLGRWSRRKRAAVVAPGLPEPVIAAPGTDDPAPPAALLQDAAPVFDPASLPPVESLTAASDFTAFLRAEVPAVLRQAALRRAWTLDPAIRDFIGPADYAWDYNLPDGVPGFALGLGGEGKQLLAQAIGALEQAVAPTETLPEAGPEAVVAPPGRAPEPQPEPAPPAAAEVFVPPPRRHGGAVPA